MVTNYYTLNEVLMASSTGYTDFVNCLKNYSNLVDLPKYIYASYQDWYALIFEGEDSESSGAKYNQAARLEAWLNEKAHYWQDYIERQKGLSGKQSSTSKYLDTPETTSDYSGDTHITNITKAEVEKDNTEGLNALRPYYEILMREFRKI